MSYENQRKWKTYPKKNRNLLLTHYHEYMDNISSYLINVPQFSNVSNVRVIQNTKNTQFEGEKIYSEKHIYFLKFQSKTVLARTVTLKSSIPLSPDLEMKNETAKL